MYSELVCIVIACISNVYNLGNITVASFSCMEKHVSYKIILDVDCAKSSLCLTYLPTNNALSSAKVIHIAIGQGATAPLSKPDHSMP